MLAAVEYVLLAMSVTVGLAALFPGSTEWAYEHVPSFFQDPASCRDFGWPLYALGGGLAVAAGGVGWLGSLRARTVAARIWLLLPLIAIPVWLLAWTYSQPCGQSNPIEPGPYAW